MSNIIISNVSLSLAETILIAVNVIHDCGVWSFDHDAPTTIHEKDQFVDH